MKLELRPSPEHNSDTPLAVNGTYTTAGTRRAVAAIDGTTGDDVIYRHGHARVTAPRQNHRGVGYWSDGRGRRADSCHHGRYHLIALNAKTGMPVPAFGNGVVDPRRLISRVRRMARSGRVRRR